MQRNVCILIFILFNLLSENVGVVMKKNCHMNKAIYPQIKFDKN